MSDTKTTREIDLLDLFSSFGRGIKDLFMTLIDAILWCLFFGIKRYKILVLFFILGLSYGIYRAIKVKPTYSSSMIIRSNAISSFRLKAILDEYNINFRVPNSYSNKILMSDLELDSTQLSDIKGIETYYAIDLNDDGNIDFFDLDQSHNPSDTVDVVDDNYLYIKAIITDPLVLPYLQQGLVNHFSKKPMIVKENKQRLAHMKDVLKGYDVELFYLDSLQKTTYFQKNRSQITFEHNEIMIGEAHGLLVHEDKFNVNARKHFMLKDYTLHNDPITVTSDFSLAAVREHSTLISIIKYIILFTLFGFIISLLYYSLFKVSGKYLSKID